MSELGEKVKKSIERLKLFEPEDGYYLAFSGGKDSVTCKALMDMAGVKYDATYRVTSVDPPELVRFIKDVHPDVKREVPRYSEEYRNEKLAGKPITMWNLIPEQRMPPTRIARFCCKYLKESGGDGRMTVTGVRWAESVSRRKQQGAVVVQNASKTTSFSEDSFKVDQKHNSLILINDNADSRMVVEQCYKRHKTTVNPIIEWTDRNVWDFIHANKIQYCALYDEGMHRLGCIGCPMGRTKQREQQFNKWPKYKWHYLKAFERMLKIREKNGLQRRAETAGDVFNWWMEYDVLPGQMNWFEDFDETEDD